MHSSAKSNIERVLEQLGVTPDTLSYGEKAQLDDQGYRIPDLIDPSWLQDLQDTFDRLTAEEPLRGTGHQPWHEDWNEAFFNSPEENQWSGDYRQPSDPFYVAIALWMLDDFTAENGPTRVVPGSHHRRAPQFEMPDRTVDRSDQVLLTGTAGTVAIMNSHLWHGGTANRSGARRRVLHPYYITR